MSPRRAADDTALVRRELNELREQLRHAHRLTMLGTMLGSIVHEFNNILTPVMSYAEMALESPDDAALCRKAIERAYHGCDRASKIAGAILAFAGDGGRRTESGDGADVAVVVQETMLCLAFDPAKASVTVVTEIEAGCRVAMEPVSLQQVLLNLVLNALKAMKPRGGQLTIRAGGAPRSTWNIGRPRGPGTYVQIEVEDTGCGIEPERVDTVFEPFVSHTDQNPSAARSGTGLGLTICKQLVESAGGRIGVRSQVSVGTCFTIAVPAAVGERALKASA